jgi:hypothetical protein
LYNSTTDPDLNTILATTDVIITASNSYRFDFPYISTYTGGFVNVDSITQIVSDTYATTEVVSVISSPIQITGDVVVEGNLVISNTIPTLDTHATSKLYVDSQVNLKYNLLNDGDLSISKILDLQIILDGKQDVTTTSSSSPSIS